MSHNKFLAPISGCETKYETLDSVFQTDHETLDNGSKTNGDHTLCLSHQMNSKHSINICGFPKEDFQEQVNVHYKKEDPEELNTPSIAKKRENKDCLENAENCVNSISAVKRGEKGDLTQGECEYNDAEHDARRIALHQADELHRSHSSCNNCQLLQNDPHLCKSDSCFDLKNNGDYFPPINDIDNIKISMNDKMVESSKSDPVSPEASGSVIVYQKSKKSVSVIEEEEHSNIPAEIVLRSKKSLQYWVKEFSSILIEHLNKFGVCVIDNFIGEARGTRILNEVLNMEQTIPFTMGTLSQDLSNQLVRNDKITWIDAVKPPCPAIRSLLNLVDAIVLMANKSPDNGELANYAITGRTKAMVACYPGRSGEELKGAGLRKRFDKMFSVELIFWPSRCIFVPKCSGSRYIRHVDNPNKDGRCITAIYYLNKNWTKEYGGTLMIYPSKPVGAIANVDPIFDRVIFFWSDRRNPHEVLPAYRRRYAITTWYFDTEEKNEYIKRQKATT